MSKGRTLLVEHIFRIIKVKKPKYVLLENVKGLLSMPKLWDSIRYTLKQLDYGVVYKVLNSKHYGVPQNRERIWIMCKYGGWDFMEFQFPHPEPLKIFIKDILEPSVDKKYSLSQKQIDYITDAIRIKKGYTQLSGKVPLSQMAHQYSSWNGTYVQWDSSGKGYNSQQNRAYFVDSTSPTISGGEGGNHSPIIMKDDTLMIHKGVLRKGEWGDGIKQDKSFTLDRTCGNDLIVHNLQPRSPDRPSLQNNPNAGGYGHLSKSDGTTYCIDSTNQQAGQLVDNNIMNCITEAQADRNSDELPCLPCASVSNTTGIYRRLTPKECFRLMGFLKDEINLEGISDSQLYKLAGNGWEIVTVSKIFKQLFK